MDEVSGAPGPGRLALLLNAEISAVITAMRANAKWAVVPNKYNVSRGRPSRVLEAQGALQAC
jgi:hypothetical protein